MPEKQRTYFCIDMKTFYASVECAERGLDPFETDLIVADVTRGKNAICLAITPKMKAQGIKNRCRLFDIPANIKYIAARPRMQLYIDYAADIYAIYLKYFDAADIHVYSIDESFIDVTAYLGIYNMTPKQLAKTIMNDILTTLHIPSTAGIGTNLYLAKIALDITAKHCHDHMGYLDEELYKKTLWDHQPITDFWQIAGGTARRLAKYGLTTMRAVANFPEAILYKTFGINAELLIDHAWGRESCRISDIKSYKTHSKSLSFSQILPRDYARDEAVTVLKEMVYNACRELVKRHCIAARVWVGIGYSYGKHDATAAGLRLSGATARPSAIMPAVLDSFERALTPNVPIRKLSLSLCNLKSEISEGYDLFCDPQSVNREISAGKAVVDITERFGKNAVLRGINFCEGATQRERNEMIGGHRAGYDDPRTAR